MADVAIVEPDHLKAALQPWRMDVHLADTGRLIAVIGQFLCQIMVIFPVDAILITDTAMAGRRLSGQQSGTGRNAAGAGRVGVFKIGTVCSQRIQIRGLDIRMSVK